MIIKPRQVQKRFTHAEDALITTMVKSRKHYSWYQIAKALTGRSARQVKERWLNYLDPSVNQNIWTKEEENLLLEKIKEHGRKWRLISKYFNGRTDVHLKNHFNLMMRKEKRKNSLIAAQKEENKINEEQGGEKEAKSEQQTEENKNDDSMFLYPIPEEFSFSTSLSDEDISFCDFI